MKSHSRTHTSNVVKLYKHLEALALLQRGIASPIMVHLSPTHKCQMNCSFCCFRNRKDKTLDMPLDVLKIGMSQFRALGTRAVEITGGGEPCLYPHINEAIRWLHGEGFRLGINTNTVDAHLIENWNLFDWVRISLNMLDYNDDINIGPIKKTGAYISGCYIWHDLSTPETLERVVAFAEREGIASRIAPDCIVKLDVIDESVEVVRKIIAGATKSKHIFLSDFNIDTVRHNQKCYIHLIKPFFYTDGYIYPCPSTELALENDAQVADFKLCRYDEIIDFYTDNPFEIQERNCSYCKYAKQQIVLEDVLTETNFNEFA